MTDKQVSHRGRIVSIDGNRISVEIVSKSACASCQAAAFCGASELKKKIVDVTVADARGWTVGQDVEVCLSRRKGLKAVLLSYVIPVLILIILIVSLSEVEVSELIAGLVSLGGVSLYYLIIYLFRESLSGDYEFSIKS